MQGEIVNEFDLIDSISLNKDVDKLFKLKDNSAFSIALHQILVGLYEENPKQLNKYQLNLFLCMHLENSGQSCGILSCLQDWFPEHLNKFVSALHEIDASKSADTIEKAIELLPENGSWFFEKANEKSQLLMRKYDGYFSDYPDGNMPDLYRKYAENNKKNIFKIIK